jgi:hypothetical protein
MTHKAVLTNAFSRERFKRIVDQAPAGYIAIVEEPKRTLDQNSRLAAPDGRRSTAGRIGLAVSP